MRLHARVVGALRDWFASASIDRELDEELQFHFDREVQQNIGRGMTAEQARRAAAIAIGNPASIRETSRDQRAGAAVRQFARDVGHGIRLIRKAPGFSLAAVAIIALGIGSVTAIFSVVYGIALKPLPFRDPERLVNIWTVSTHTLGAGHYLVNAADERDWVAQNHVFEDIALVRNIANFNLIGDGGEPERLLGARISANLLPLLGVSPAIGRNFTEDEDEIGNDTRVILSDRFWRRRFNADPAIVGRSINLSGVPFVVVGVMGPEFQYPDREFQIWTPLTINPAELARRVPDRNFTAVARLKAGVTVNAAQGEMDAIAARLASAYQTNGDLGVDVVPMHADLLANVRTALYVMLGAVACLLLVAALNLATLLASRAAARQRELAVRLALGATRGRVALQTVAEVTPLLALGGAAGLLLASAAVNWFVPLAPAALPRVENIAVSGTVLAASMTVLFLTGIIATLLPAAQAWRADLTTASREQNRVTTASARQMRTRSMLVVTQIALALPLLIGAMLLARTFSNLTSISPGFRPQGVLSVHLAIPRSKYRDDATIARLIERIDERAGQVPGVIATGLVNRLPLAGGAQVMTFEFDAPVARQAAIPSVDLRSATPGYFKAMGIPLIDGRNFEPRDTAGAPQVALIDERVARTMWPGERAVGKRLRVPAALNSGMSMPWIDIIGVVGHVIHDGIDLDTRPQIYFHQQQRAQDRMVLVARTDGDPAALSPMLREVIREIDPEQPVYDVRTLEDVVARSLGQRWLNTVLLGVFAATSLLLCCVGVYGVIAFGVAQARREFGIRLALGATPRRIAAAVLKRGVLLASAGTVGGLVIAGAMTRGMRAMLFAVSPADAVSFLICTAIMIGVVLISSYVPARRAAAVDPATTLRAD